MLCKRSTFYVLAPLNREITDTVETLNAFIPWDPCFHRHTQATHDFTLLFTHSVTMEETPNNNNTVDLTTTEEVSDVSRRVVFIEDSSEIEAKAEEEELTKEKKRRSFHVEEPTPQRTTRTDIKQYELASLQPVPSVTEEPLQSFSIEELEERLRDKLPDLTEADIEIMTM